MDAAIPAIPEPFFALYPVQLDIGVGGPGRQSRVTVAFRALLVLPHVVVLAVLSLVAIPLVVVGWFAALALGRLPRWIATYVMSVIAYAVRVNAYGFMLAGEFPSFSLSLSHSEYPVTVEVGASQLSRVKVFFRLLLVIPAYIVTLIAGNGLFVLSPVIWLVTLVLGRMPQPFFGAAAAMIRYQARYSAYIGLVTDSYPRRLFGDSAADWAEEGYRVPRSGGTEVVTCVIIVLGIASVIWNIVLSNELRSKSDPALVTAERQLEDAAHTYENSVALCGSGAKGLSCLETAGSAWGESFDRFASSLSRVSFSGSQREQAAALGHDARTVGHALRSASNSQTGSEYAKAVLAAQRLLPTFEADAKSLLGHGL